MASFMVIIIGGSVAGLTLANILEAYDMEYILFEKYEAIAPSSEPALGFYPMVLKCWINSELKKMSRPCANELKRCKYSDQTESISMSRTHLVSCWQNWYKFKFLDRQELIQALYDNLRDKSRVYVSKELIKFNRFDNEVHITTKDGATFRGDLLVGADGVHSRTRKEMWRCAELEDPQYGSRRMAESIICTYKCMFGIADCPGGISKETGFKPYHKNRSFLCQSGREGKVYFFAFIKNLQKIVNRSIPWCTVEDERAVIDDYGEDILRPGVTFGDIYRRRRHAILVPLEEYVLDRCYYKRAILTGDSFHKFNPLTGQDGNSAVEDAALLGDLLKEILQKYPRPTDATIQTGLADFQQQRRPRTKPLQEKASSLQALEAHESHFRVRSSQSGRENVER